MMQNSVDNAEQAEVLVNTLHIDGTTLNDANLSGLSSSDLEQLADLEAELQCINASDIETGEEIIEVKQMLDEELVETEIGEHEIEIETEEIEQSISPDEILPDFKDHAIKYEEESETPPPLRPLTIAPKPSGLKVPMAIKSAMVNASTGQQIFLIQSPGGSTSTVNLGGQPIKLLSTQGQVTLPNFQNVTLTNKPGIVRLQSLNKNATVTQATENTTIIQPQLKSVSAGTVKKIIPQNKNIVAKVILGGQQGQVVLTSQANDASQPQQIKLVSSSLGSTAKTITLAQAQQMGLIPQSSKVQQILPQQSGKQVVVNKPIQAKTIKMVPQVKSPTKILPAPIQTQKIQGTKSTPQRVIIRQGGQLKSGTVVASGMNQIIRIPGTQGINPGQLHQINVPGKGVQYVRFMTATTTAPSTTTTNTTSVPKVITQTSTAQKAQVVPVGGITVNRSLAGNKVTPSNTSQNLIKVLPISTTQTRPVAPKPVSSGQRLIIPATNSQSRPTQTTITTIPASALSQIQGTLIPSNNNVSQIVMLPAQYVQQIQNQSSTNVSPPNSKPVATAKTTQQKTIIKVSPNQAKENVSLATSETQNSSPENTNYSRPLEPNGIRPRKPCNCTKSLCLKLYCDCFANGEFCYLCNCMNCYNNLSKEEERQRAIRNCLERNPNAFRPKIGKGRDAGESSVRKHTKGCNCKRSGCLKNYCECYEAKIACSSNCKCIGCRNIEDSMEKKYLRPLVSMPETTSVQVVPMIKSKQALPTQDHFTFRPLMTAQNNKVPSNYMTNEVIEATNQCMIAQADEAERNMMTEELAKKMILEEFGRCLVQIIECSHSASSGNT